MYNHEKMVEATKLFLEAIGEDVNRDGLKDTPDRVARYYGSVLNGLDLDPSEHLRVFEEKTRNMVVVTDIPFYSFCEHHIAPFFGKMAIAYIPNGRVLGLSKLVRMARVYCKRVQIQERLTDQIAEEIGKALEGYCLGVAVHMKAEHMCMSIRGVRTPGAKTTTCRLTGVFLNKPEVREEFFNALK